MKKAIYLCIIALLTFLFTLFVSCDSTVGTEEAVDIQQSSAILSNIASGGSVTLVAGQNMDVGTVSVLNEGGSLKVTFATDQNWCLLETHLHIWGDTEESPVNRKGNPVPGRFEYSETHNCLSSFTYEPGESASGNWNIAAHAVVQTGEAPYYASFIVDANQGLRMDGSPVLSERSDPENALEYETGHDPSNFFSLGLGGDIVLGFDCPITNGPDDDIRIVEDTWGSYPLESALVYASQDGNIWELLGQADNMNRDATHHIHTESFFNLETAGLESANYIKVLDNSDPVNFNNRSDADGYDLNAVEALHNCADITEETAWGDGVPFVESGRGNWGTYFTYQGSN